MKSINSPYVLEVYRLDKNKNEYYIEFEDFSLCDYILKNNQKLSFIARRKICLQIIRLFMCLTELGFYIKTLAIKCFTQKISRRGCRKNC